MAKSKTSEVKFSFYNIIECGFFNTTSEPFGSILELLNDLYSWSKKQEFGDTKLFEPKDESDSLSTYLFNISFQGDDWFITTWNETSSTEAGIASVMKNSKPSAPKVVVNSVEPNSIPGYPTYFWFMPKEKIFASVRFNNKTLTGYASLKRYLREALTLVSSRLDKKEVTNEEGEKIEILGFKDDTGNVIKALPKFNARRAKNNYGNIDKILQNSTNIIKIERKATLNLTVNRDFQIWQKLCAGMGLTKQYSKNIPYNVKYEVPFEGLGDTETIQKIIDDWNKSENSRTEWDDFGFTFRGESHKTYWLSSELLSAKTQLDIVENEQGIIDNESLLKLLVKHKKSILSQIER